jgi:hypothetical protein
VEEEGNRPLAHFVSERKKKKGERRRRKRKEEEERRVGPPLPYGPSPPSRLIRDEPAY